MPVYLYVLESVSSKLFYVGMTTNLENRLLEHNSGKSKFTKGHLPWKIVYYEQVNDFKEGRIREKYLKSNAGKSFLKKHFEKIGHVPFTDETRVRFPYGLQQKAALKAAFFVLCLLSLSFLAAWQAYSSIYV